jgi:predicted CXXCH cytochrome family protein
MIILSIFFIPSGPFTLETHSAQESPCVGCHVDFKKSAKSVHAALGMGCAACHKAVEGKNHPAEKGSVILTQDMLSLCYSCHDESKFKGKSVHSPVSGGMCTGCHNPHQSDYPKILLKDVPGLCYNCHDESKFKGTSGHTAVGMCNGCHNPHSSNSVKLLKGEQPEVCYTCHDKSKFSKKYTHSIIPSGGCTSCHSPHLSKYPSLLTNTAQELCLTCHIGKSDGRHVVTLPGKRIHPVRGKDPSTVKMIKVPDPKRPGKEIEIEDPNTPAKEITCVTCHDPHSSDFTKLFTQKNICARCHKYY